MNDDIAQVSALDDLLTTWLYQRPSATALNYRSVIKRLGEASRGVDLLKLTPGQLIQAMQVLAKTASPSTQVTLTAVVKSFYKHLAQQGVRSDDPSKVLRSPKVRNTLAERMLSHQEIELLLAQANETERLIILLGYIAGLRVSEMCALRACDLVTHSSGNTSLRIFGKGGKTASVRIPEGLARELAVLATRMPVGDTAPLLATLTPKQAWRALKRLSRLAGLSSKLSPHWLRHAHASAALAAGADVVTVQRSLRHSNIQTTMAYVHLKPEGGSSLFIPPLAGAKSVSS